MSPTERVGKLVSNGDWLLARSLHRNPTPCTAATFQGLQEPRQGESKKEIMNIFDTQRFVAYVRTNNEKSSVLILFSCSATLSFRPSRPKTHHENPNPCRPGP